MGYTYTKKVLVVCLKLKCNSTSYALSGKTSYRI